MGRTAFGHAHRHQPPAENHRKKIAYGAAIVGVVVMGSLGIFVRNISADPAIIAFTRLSLGFMFLLWFLASTRNFRALKISISLPLLASGVSIGLCIWSYIETITHSSLANAAFLLYLGPLLAVAFAYLLLKEKIAPGSALLIGLSFLGCVLIFRFDLSFSNTEVLGITYGLLSASSYALFIVLTTEGSDLRCRH
jgi:drug/metabolite transporter (DMT)-like permease